LKTFKIPAISAIAWLIICTVLLTLPGNDLPKEDWLDKIWFDKWVHIGLFAILTWLWCLAFRIQRKEISYIIGAACLCYGIIMEFVQRYYIPNRSFDTGDIAADAIGCVAGLLFWYYRFKKN
jgi:VanZ family protein